MTANLAIIRQGDPTSHGGTVLEGFSGFNVLGRNAAGVGHRGYCPRCKSDFVILAGAENFQFFGRSVAVEGMQTSCGAALVATQRAATVQVRLAAQGNRMPPAPSGARSGAEPAEAEEYECYFLAQNQDGSAANLAYRIDVEGAKIHEGSLDSCGATLAFPANRDGKPTFWIQRT